MQIKSLAIRIKYRIRIDKSDKKNECFDRSRKSGFYWVDDITAEPEIRYLIAKEMKRIKKEISELDDIPEWIKTVKYPKDTEALQIEVYVGLEGNRSNGETSYFNGGHRLNTTFEYFHTVMK